MSKHIIITGTSRGMGYELVKLFAKEGHQILALSRNADPIRDLNLPNISAFSFDITLEKSITQVGEFISKQWDNTVDILIHNAGYLVKDKFENISLETLKAVYDTNFFGVFKLTQSLLPYLAQTSHVIAVSTMGGIQGSVKFPELSAYSSSKAAVINLMEILAEEFKETGPAFNALALGAVQTEMFEEAFPGLKAGLSAKDMAEYIAYFALNGHKVYNGKVLQVSNSTP